MPSYMQETSQNISIKEAKNSISEKTQKWKVSTGTFYRWISLLGAEINSPACSRQ